MPMTRQRADLFRELEGGNKPAQTFFSSCRAD